MGGAGNYNLLSSYLSFDQSGGFKYYDNSFNIISPSTAGLTGEQAKLVHLSRLELTFVNDEDIFSLSSFIYPYNFKFGQKMSYHE